MEEEKTRDDSKIERVHSINLYVVPVVVVEARSTQGTGETDTVVSGTNQGCRHRESRRLCTCCEPCQLRRLDQRVQMLTIVKEG
jgi:hypothetical protein